MSDEEGGRSGENGHETEIDGERFKAGDPKVFTAIVGRFRPLVWSIVNSYVSAPDDGDDLCQDIFCRVWDQREKYEGGDLGGWIGRLAHNHARNWRKASKARRAGLERYNTSHVIPSKEANTLLTAPWKITRYHRLRDAVRDALAQIPEGQAKAFELVHVERLGIRKAAQRMGISRSTVRAHIWRARKALRQHLAAYNHDLP